MILESKRFLLILHLFFNSSDYDFGKEKILVDTSPLFPHIYAYADQDQDP